MEKYLLLILSGATGGWLAQKGGLPGGMVVGSMLASGTVALLFRQPVVPSPAVGVLIQLVLGISLGMTFDRSLLGELSRTLPLAIFSTLALLGVAVAMAYLAHRLGLVDFATALFGFSPGGMSGMSILAQSEGHKTPVVALLHLVRVFTLFIAVPQLGRWFLLLAKKL